MKFSYTILVCFIYSVVISQDINAHRAIIYKGDTIANMTLKEHYVYYKLSYKQRREQYKLTKLIRKVKKVYPYAKLAGIKFKQYSNKALQIESKKEKKQFFKNIEKELNQEFGSELKKLTISEGKILIKLIDRQTGKASFYLLKEFRGVFSAYFWQGLARIFGQNLKINYDSQNEDKKIEWIVNQIEKGNL